MVNKKDSDINNGGLFTKKNMTEAFSVLIRLIIGCAVYSLSIDIFYSPAKLLGGGVTGFAQILNYSMGLSTGLMIMLINIPLFILALIFVDKGFTLYSLAGMLLLSLFIELFSKLSLPFQSNLTAVAFGGILNGIGLGIVYRSGASFGGTDIIAKIIQRKYAGNMAYTGLVINAFVVGLSAFIYGLDQAILTLCAMYISSQVNTMIIDGMDHRRALSIITKHPNEVAQAIYAATGHGATVLIGQGAYTHADEDMLYSVISKRQLAKAKRAIRDVDPEAFFTIAVVTGVYGHGRDFKSVSQDIR